MPRNGKTKEGVVLLIDVGEAVSQEHSDGQSFLDKSKQCASRIIERKIFSDCLEKYALVLFGSDHTQNDLDYQYINVRNNYFVGPSWDLLKEVMNLKPSIVNDADWLDGLVVAINLLKGESEIKQISSLKIVMMSNFACPVRSTDQVEDIVGALKKLKINLVVIGPELDDSESEHKSKIQKEGENIIGQIVEEVDGAICGFDEAMSHLDHYQKVTATPVPWNCDLQIGTDIFIPISAYKKVVSNIIDCHWTVVPDKEYRKIRSSQSMSKPTLKKFLEDRGLPTVGTIADLEIRLRQDLKDKGEDPSVLFRPKNETRTLVPDTNQKYGVKNLFKWSKKSINGNPVIEESVFFEGDKQVAKEDVIHSYQFGQTVVPFSEDDRLSVKLETEKCFQLIGFTKKENVPRHILLGDSSYCIVPQSKNQAALKGLPALAKAVLESGMVGIVRRVYCKNTAPKIGALIPCFENDCYFFHWVQLPWAEDERKLTLPSLADVKPSQEQLDAVDQLIDAMDLSQFDEDDDPYSKLVDPAVENTNEKISFKALNPSAPLPLEPSEAIVNLLKPMKEILMKASDALDNIRRCFPLEEIEQKTYRKGAAEVFKRASNKIEEVDNKPKILSDSVASFIQSKVTEIGTVDPEGNFLKLLEQGEPFEKLNQQMQNVIKKLIQSSSSSVGTKKSISAIKLLREHCVLKNSLSFNQFITSLKDDLLQRDNTAFWDLIVKDRLGLITIDESQESKVSADEANVFYEMNKVDTEEVHYEMEAEDLLDEI